MSYRGKKKSNYSQQKRSRFSNPFRRKNRNKNSSNPCLSVDSASAVYPPTAPPVPMQPPELWLKSPTTFTYNGFRARLSNDPNNTPILARMIAELATKRKIQLELVSGDTTKLFDVLSLGEVENPEVAITLAPQIEPLRVALSAWGYTLAPVIENQET